MREHAPAFRKLPHPRLVAYPLAIEGLVLVRDARIRDPKLRDQALRAPKSVGLNLAGGAGRVSPADQARVSGIARDELLEVAAAIEVASVREDVDPCVQAAAAPLLDRLYTRFIGLAR